MCVEEVKSLELETCSMAKAQDYWKLLKKFSTENSVAKLVPNGLILQIGENSTSASLYSPMSFKPVMEKITFLYFLESGYAIIALEDESVLLFTPKGNIKMKFIYKKDYFTNVNKTVKNGVVRYCSGYMLLTKFIFSYNTIAVRCQNKCYLGKANKFDLKKLFYVGEYDDIVEMQDNKEGLVYVRFSDGRVKLFNQEFKEILLNNAVSKIVFLENGDFFAFNKKVAYLYNKKGNFVQKKDEVLIDEKNVLYKNRFYQIGEKTFDCRTHKECEKNLVSCLEKSDGTLYYEKGQVFWTYNFKKIGLEKVRFEDVLFNVEGHLMIVNKKFLAFGKERKVFVVEIGKSLEETKALLKDFIENDIKGDDLDLETFDYFREFCSHLKREKISLKGILYKELI